MKKSIREALEEASATLEYIQERYPDLTLQEKVDIGARLKAVAKACETVDKNIKVDITLKLKGKEGSVAGELFKAIRKWVDKRVFDGKAFKAAQPAMAEKYTTDGGNYEIRFEPR